MLKKEITYNNFDNESKTETFYFNLTKIEIIKLNADYDDDVSTLLERIGSGDAKSKEIIAFFEDLFGRSYGEKLEGGRFIKSKELTSSFLMTDAYSELFLEVMTDAAKAAAFINGLMPADVIAQVERERADRDKDTPSPERTEEMRQRLGSLEQGRPNMPTRRELRDEQN